MALAFCIKCMYYIRALALALRQAGAERGVVYEPFYISIKTRYGFGGIMLELYAIRDDKAGYFEKPFPAKSVVEAMRSVSAAASSEKTVLGMYPSDFSLFRVGKFDDMTGEIPADLKAPHLVGTVLSILGTAGQMSAPKNEVKQ